MLTVSEDPLYVGRAGLLGILSRCSKRPAEIVIPCGVAITWRRKNTHVTLKSGGLNWGRTWEGVVVGVVVEAVLRARKIPARPRVRGEAGRHLDL